MKYYERMKVFNKKIKDYADGRFLYVYFWAFIQYIRNGTTFGNFILYNLADKSFSERNKYIGKRERLHYEKIFNRKNTDLFVGKSNFNRIFSEFLNRDFIYLKECTYKEFENFVKKHPTFFVKPNWLCEGSGIEKTTISDNFEDEFKKFTQKDIIFEEPIVQHEKLEKLNSSSVNTIRVSTLRINNETVVLAASLKVGSGESCTDNIDNGGIACPIDINSGIVKAYGFDMEGNKYLKHPVSNIVLPGFEIPYWDQVISLAKNGAKVVDGVDWIGWDIAITPKGVVFVEGNTDQGVDIIQLNNQGLNPKIKALLKK